ncbi:MAG: response regulator [Chloroflexi bacterium]|nr:response regulator [Chloroflexota bacterium]
MISIAATLRVLIVEDSIDDVLLLQRELKRSGYGTAVRRVENAPALAAALDEAEWDVVLCDYVIPGLDIMDALREVQRRGLDIPFIIVSGRVGEDEAASALKAGAHDFVTKERLHRLVPSIERELRESAERARHRAAEQALRESEERYRLLVESIQDYAICLVDAAGSISSWNGGAERIFGYESAHICGSHFSRLFRVLEGTQNLPTQILDAAGRVGSYESEVWCTRADGSALLASILLTAVRTGDGDLRGYTLVCRDITEQMRIAEERMQSQKLEVIGRLAGSVAHDFNNLLTIVSGFTELLQQSIPPDETHQMYLDEITKASNQAASLTQQLLAFGRRQLLQPKVIDLNEVIGGMETMLRRLIGENLELVTQSAAAPSLVRADEVQIQQALLNLVINARDAMPVGGCVTIATSIAEEAFGSDREVIPVVTLSVSDTGQGMDEQTISRIFEPFFTTKEIGKGSGLGLATVDGIVAQSGGRIRVESQLGQGTTFTIVLPLTDDDSVSGDKSGGPTAAASGSETVLLVEDEPALRRLSRRVLAQFGYTVMEAPNGEEALKLAEAYEGPIHLVLTDVVMPRMSGSDLATHVRESHPEARILFMSGYTDDAVVQHGVQTQEVSLLRKPFTPYALAARVREVLDRVAVIAGE